MAEIRKPESNAGMIAQHEDRLRRVESLASRAPTGTLTVEFANQSAVENSATFAPFAHTEPLVVLNPVLVTRFLVDVPVGTTGEFRMYEGRSAAATDALSISGQQVFLSFEWVHGVPLSDSWAHFQLQARRVSGAGDVRVWAPRRWETASIVRVPNANEAGNPTVL